MAVKWEWHVDAKQVKSDVFYKTVVDVVQLLIITCDFDVHLLPKTERS